MRPHAASSSWAGVPDPEEAAPIAIGAYLGAFGPATPDGFGAWLAGGRFGTRKLQAWFSALGDRLARVDVEGQPAYVLAEHLDELVATRPTDAVRLLGGFDQYVLGPGTADEHVVPAGRRAAVSKQAGWIAPVVVGGGVVSGTWELADGSVRIAWFREAGRLPRTALHADVARLSGILDRDLSLETSLS